MSKKPKQTKNKDKSSTSILIFNYCPVLGFSYNVIKIFN